MSGMSLHVSGLVALVVDDETNVRLLARAALETIGFEVLEATTGEEALELLVKARPDVILLDVMMPGISGYDVCAQLRTRHEFENVPIVMMTGLDDLESINRAYEVGATDFLAKPVNWELMKYRVRYTIRSSIAFRSLADAQRTARMGSWEATTAEGRLTCSGETYRVLGLSRSSHLSLDGLLANVKAADRDQVEKARRAALETGTAYEVEYAISAGEGGDRFIHERGEVIGTGKGRRVVGTVQDITERRDFENRITFMAYHDSLTGLPNRRLFEKRLARELVAAGRHGHHVGVLCFDLDGFKRVNDTFGHGVGDQVLQTVAERVRGCIRTEDSFSCDNREATLSRSGGDEFAILLRAIAVPEDAARVAERILRSLARPYRVGQTTLRITPSIGITVYPDDGVTVATLLKNADLAMYHAKSRGRNNYQFFTSELHDRAQHRMALESALEHALERGELYLNYQPIFDPVEGHVSTVEALIRWHSPTLGQVSPAELISVAEHSDLIVPIGEWVLRSACAQFKEWMQLPSPPARVAVNVSAVQVRQPGFVRRVKEILEELDFAPENLEIELTESVLMDDLDAKRRIFEELQAFGMTVAIDDFGTGYSSLSYLRHIRPDVLKIDRSFITDIDRDPESRTIVGAIIAMAHGLGVQVTAEGVETDIQFEYLRGAGCDSIQGLLLAPAGAAGAIGAVLAAPPLMRRGPDRRSAA